MYIILYRRVNLECSALRLVDTKYGSSNFSVMYEIYDVTHIKKHPA